MIATKMENFQKNKIDLIRDVSKYFENSYKIENFSHYDCNPNFSIFFSNIEIFRNCDWNWTFFILLTKIEIFRRLWLESCNENQDFRIFFTKIGTKSRFSNIKSHRNVSKIFTQPKFFYDFV